MPTLFIGNNTIRLPIVESTNAYAQDLAKQLKVPEGTVIITDNQTLGRGQRGNSWLCEPGKNLTFSLILYPPDLAAENQFVLTQLISLAIVDFVKSEYNNAEQVKIKWPNDIYIGKQKIAGILIENSVRGNSISNSIIGIGLNINQLEFAELRATSLAKLTNNNFDLESCLTKVCSAIEARYLQWINKNQQGLNTEYQKNLFLLQEIAQFELKDERIEGKIIGVNKAGKLLLSLTKNFDVLELGFKEVKFIF
jgi:BirA family transcriptional regulator, biotin operon repressor / biotin---[acetyl-CoA-carboxylase] ligase